MKPIIRIIAYDPKATSLFKQSHKLLLDKIPACTIAEDSMPANTLFFASGGSEQFALEAIKTQAIRFLLAGKSNNGWAAASEVLAWSNANGFSLQLFSIDQESEINHYLEHCNASKHKILHQKRIGLIGEVSDWLVASGIDEQRMQNIFGATLVHLPWDTLPDYLTFPEDNQMPEIFPGLQHQQKELASISSFLKATVENHQLDALTIQCFKMVREKEVTACLPVALMNYNNIPAGCEGDLTSIFGMLLLKELTGQIPWMANIASINEDHILLAHCTAPLQMAAQFNIRTHFETDLSAAVEAQLDVDVVTIFRVDNQLKHFFVAEGKVRSKPTHDWACRTQIEVNLSKDALNSLRQKPLGNHHLILKGRWSEAVRLVMQQHGILSNSLNN